MHPDEVAQAGRGLAERHLELPHAAPDVPELDEPFVCLCLYVVIVYVDDLCVYMLFFARAA